MEYQVIKEWQAEEQFQDYIDEATDEIKILGLVYSPSIVFKQVDPIAYGVIFDEFANHLWEDGTAIEGYNDDDLITCNECEIITDDHRDTLCKDCDKQGEEDA
jgi:hypothetical protein